MKSRTTLVFIIYSLFLASCKQTNEQLVQEAVRLASKKKFQEAIAIYTKVVSNNNKIELAYFNRGKCYHNISQYDSALNDFNTILSGKPTNGIIISINPDSPDAIEEDRAKVPLNDLFYHRAMTKVYMDSMQSAYRDFQMLIDANYKKAFCTIWQGDIWHILGHNEKACRFMQRAKRLATSDEERKEADKKIKEYCLAGSSPE
ncbi:MAG: tetratricopeptide repeat protein [Chitinophagaceae bacterium]